MTDYTGSAEKQITTKHGFKMRVTAISPTPSIQVEAGAKTITNNEVISEQKM